MNDVASNLAFFGVQGTCGPCDFSSLDLVTGPLAGSPAAAYYPVTLDEVKTHLRISDTAEDDYLNTLIELATEYAQNFTWRAFLTQTWQVKFDGFPAFEILLPRPPLQSVTSIQYVDTAGVTQTVDPSLYQVDAKAQPGRVLPAFGQVWPWTREATPGALTITFVAGFGDTVAAIPAGLRHAVKFLVAHFYEQRESFLVGARLMSVDVPYTLEALLNMHSMRRF